MTPSPFLQLPIFVKIRLLRLFLIQGARLRGLRRFLISTRHPLLGNRRGTSLFVRAIDRERGLNVFKQGLAGYSAKHAAGVRDTDGFGAGLVTRRTESCDGAFVVILAVEVGMLTLRTAWRLHLCALTFCEVLRFYWRSLIDGAIDVV